MKITMVVTNLAVIRDCVDCSVTNNSACTAAFEWSRILLVLKFLEQVLLYGR